MGGVESTDTIIHYNSFNTPAGEYYRNNSIKFVMFACAVLIGFRVLSVSKGSPAHLAGLEVFFDVIVEADGINYMGHELPYHFISQMSANSGETIKLVVYNCRTHGFRGCPCLFIMIAMYIINNIDIWVTPRQWETTSPGSLGISIRRIDNIFKDYNGLKVLKVFPNSPASDIGLQEDIDYLMGCAEDDFQSPEDLTRVLNSRQTFNEGRLFVMAYNIKCEICRNIELRPNIYWGGPGRLGLDLGVGLIHRLPDPIQFHKGTYTHYILINKHNNQTVECHSQLITNLQNSHITVHNKKCHSPLMDTAGTDIESDSPDGTILTKHDEIRMNISTSCLDESSPKKLLNDHKIFNGQNSNHRMNDPLKEITEIHVPSYMLPARPGIIFLSK